MQNENQKKANKKEVVLEDRDENNSQESGDVDWLALPVAKPRDEKPPEVEKSFEDEDRYQARASKWQPKAARKDGPEKAPPRSFDDEPVGVHNWHPNPDDERPQVASFGGRGANQPRDEAMAIDDLPIKPLAEPYGLEALAVDKQRSSLSDARSAGSHAAPKGYDFEKMIEVAM